MNPDITGDQEFDIPTVDKKQSIVDNLVKRRNKKQLAAALYERAKEKEKLAAELADWQERYAHMEKTLHERVQELVRTLADTHKELRTAYSASASINKRLAIHETYMKTAYNNSTTE